MFSLCRESFIDLVEDHSSSDDENRSDNNTTQKVRVQQDCNASASSNFDILCGQDENDDNESNYLSNDVDVSDSDRDYITDIIMDSDDLESIESANSDNDLDHDEIELRFENKKEEETYLIKVLRIWVLESGLLSKRKLDLLLAKLKPLFPRIPASYKTLLHTLSSIQIIQMEVNFGIKVSLQI